MALMSVSVSFDYCRDMQWRRALLVTLILTGMLPNLVSISRPICTAMHHSKVSDNYDYLPHNQDSTAPTPPQYRDMVVQPLGNRQAAYDEFINGCVEKYGPSMGKRCLSTERDRVEMSLRQPQSMQNYTELGYKKIKAPPALFKLIQDFWNANKDKGKPENWGAANTYT
jgi:prolyl 4-hydroxylase